MSQKKRVKGLKFNYIKDGGQLLDKYESIEELSLTKFPKNNNLSSPDLSTKIFNIRWNNNLISLNNKIETLNDLINILQDKNILVTNKDIRMTKRKLINGGLERKGTYSIDCIRDLTKELLFAEPKTNPKIFLDGDLIKPNSQRYQTFFTKGCNCVVCGIKGSFFAKERIFGSNEVYHLNLYAIDTNGNEVLMTKDHIIPKSKGGRNTIDNYQTMCCKCNFEKGNQLEK